MSNTKTEQLAKLSDEEIDFIVTSVNDMFHNSHDRLMNDKHLGDRQIENLNWNKTTAKEIMRKLEVIQ